MEFESKKQFQEMVKEEVQRLAIREVVEDRPKKNKWFETLRHPLLSVLIGFVLTGIIGTMLTNSYQEKEKKRLLQREAFQHIRQFDQTLNLRITESRYLSSALTRCVDKEILMDKKKAYDLAAKQWNTNLFSHLLTFREYADARNRIFIENNIENNLVPIFRAIDKCLTEEYDAVMKGATPDNGAPLLCWLADGELVYSVELSDVLKALSDCGYDIANLMFNYVAINLKITDDAWDEHAPNVEKNIANNCKFCTKLNLDPSISIPSHRSAVKLWFDCDRKDN